MMFDLYLTEKKDYLSAEITSTIIQLQNYHKTFKFKFKFKFKYNRLKITEHYKY